MRRFSSASWFALCFSRAPKQRCSVVRRPTSPAMARRPGSRRLLLPLLMTAAVLCFSSSSVATDRRPAALLRLRPAATAAAAVQRVVRRVLAAAAAPIPDAAAAAAPAPSPAEAAREEPVDIFYAAVFLNSTTSEELQAIVPPVWETISADHMVSSPARSFGRQFVWQRQRQQHTCGCAPPLVQTMAFKPSLNDTLGLPLGRAATLRVLGEAADNRTQVPRRAHSPPPGPLLLPVRVLLCQRRRLLPARHRRRRLLPLACRGWLWSTLTGCRSCPNLCPTSPFQALPAWHPQLQTAWACMRCGPVASAAAAVPRLPPPLQLTTACRQRIRAT